MIIFFRYLLITSVLLTVVIKPQDSTHLKLDYIDDPLPFGIMETRPASLPKVSLALSGGGSRGLAQIGFLKALEMGDIPIDIIVGTSMGSIIGGLYSAGYSSDELDSIAVNTPWNDFFAFDETDRNELFVDQKITEDRAIFALRLEGLKPVIPTSLNTGQKISNFLNLVALNAPLHPKNNFDDLLHKFKAISTDLVTGKLVILDKGSLSLAMRASSSVSLLLAPVKKDSLILVDGGLVENIPVTTARNIGGEVVIAINTTSPLLPEEELNYPWKIADQIVSIPMQILNKQQVRDADILFEPKLSVRLNTDFSDIDGMIKEGYNSTISQLNSIKKIIEEKFKEKANLPIKYFKNLGLSSSPSGLELQLIHKYSILDSVSNLDILYDLSNIYQEGGYRDLSADIIPSGRRNILKINESINPPVKSITIEGITLVSQKKVYHEVQGLLYRSFNGRELLKSLIGILKLYRLEGYSLAEIEKVEYDKESENISIDISEGFISRIIIEGNEKTMASIIKRELTISEGKFFRYSDLAKGLLNLRSTNLFDFIELRLNKKSTENEITISVKEKNSGLLRFGLRIDNENLTQISLDLRDENLFGMGSELGVIFSGGLRNRSFTLEHKANRIFDTYLSYKLRAFQTFSDINVYKDDSTNNEFKFSRSKISEYRQIHSGIALGLGTQVERFGNLYLEGRYSWNEIKNKIDYTGELSKLNLAVLKLGLFIDSQNKYPYPTNGFLVNGYYETAQKILGGDVGYFKIKFDYKSYLTLNTHHTIAVRFVIGFADQTLPLSEQFSLGGHSSFFGLRDNEFRGRQIFHSSAEYRVSLPIKIFFDTYLMARYDLGSIWAQTEQIRFRELRHGIGASLSFDTPIGPADFAVGKSFILKKALPDNKTIWGPTYFYFTIGYYY